MVLAAAGLGLYYVSGRVNQDMVQPLYTLGIFSLFVGIGFIASAALSFALSKRLGLFDPPATTSAARMHEDGHLVDS